MFKLSEAAQADTLSHDGPDAEVRGVTIDSRKAGPGDLFVALRGERMDGHRFVDAALSGGAAGALVSDRAAVATEAAPLLLTPDTRLGLGHLAAWWRARFSIPVVAITGSNGKTSVKEMLAAIFRAHVGHEAVLATEGNLNNDIGLPLTLLRLRREHRYAAVEMGMNHLGEIRYITKIGRPTVALINNAGTAHIGELGSRDNIARAKGEIFEGLGDGGIRVFNADDDYAGFWTGLEASRRMMTFGIDRPADIRGRVALHTDGSVVEADTPAGPVAFRLQVPGMHNARNALAATAAAVAVGVPLDRIAEGLSRHADVAGRLQRKSGPRGCLVIDDTYNANPDSMKAAVAWLSALPGRRVFVMGDMGELGPGEIDMHREVGVFARERGLETLFALGAASRHAVEAFGAAARSFDDVDSLVAALEPLCGRDLTILVKGSRFMRMERVVAALLGATPDGGVA